MEKQKDGQTLSYGTLPAINGGPIIERIVQIFLGIKSHATNQDYYDLR